MPELLNILLRIPLEEAGGRGKMLRSFRAPGTRAFRLFGFGISCFAENP